MLSVLLAKPVCVREAHKVTKIHEKNTDLFRKRGDAFTLKEASSIASCVDPGGVVIADPPHHTKTVGLNHTQMPSDLTPEPVRDNKDFDFLFV